jgi:hypothetical protein
MDKNIKRVKITKKENMEQCCLCSFVVTCSSEERKEWHDKNSIHQIQGKILVKGGNISLK